MERKEETLEEGKKNRKRKGRNNEKRRKGAKRIMKRKSK